MFDLNPFDAVEAMSGQNRKLEPQKPKSAAPLISKLCQSSEATYTLQEKGFSFSGEDFMLTDANTGSPVIRLSGSQKASKITFPLASKFSIP